MCEVPGIQRVCRECYSRPADVHEALRRRGMDLVTLTDHDSIEGAEPLRRFPHFFLSEEVTCRMPSGTQAHIGVYGITERNHVELQRRRNDLPGLLAYLNDQKLFFSLNHPFSALTGARAPEDFDWFESMFPAYETRNGHMLRRHNQLAESVARRLGRAMLGGSDAHALASVGTAYTEVPGARTKADFLRGLREGRGIPAGDQGSYVKLTRDVFTITGAMVKENPWTAFLLPLAPIIPFYTLAVLLHEANFARRWSVRAAQRGRSQPVLPTRVERPRIRPHVGPRPQRALRSLEANAWS